MVGECPTLINPVQSLQKKMDIGWIILSRIMLEKLVISSFDINASSILAPAIDQIAHSFLVVKALCIEPVINA